MQPQYFQKVLTYKFDGEGRILITTKLLKHAKIKNNILFVGQGKLFKYGNLQVMKIKVTAKKKSKFIGQAFKMGKTI